MNDARCRALLGGSRHLGVPKVRPLSDSCSRWQYGGSEPQQSCALPCTWPRPAIPTFLPSEVISQLGQQSPECWGGRRSFCGWLGVKKYELQGMGAALGMDVFTKTENRAGGRAAKPKVGVGGGATGAGRTAPTALAGPWEPATKLSALHASGLGKQGSRTLSDPTHWQVSLGLVCFGILSPC